MKFKIVLFSTLLLTGCSSFYPVEEEVSLPVNTGVSTPDLQNIYMTQAYETAATRATNRMLDDTADIYETKQHPKLYIKQTVKDSPNLPDGFYTARRAMREIVGGSGTFVVVNTIDEADYILDSRVSQIIVGDLPAIVFKLGLNNQNDEPVRAWNVVIKQMAEDQSWW